MTDIRTDDPTSASSGPDPLEGLTPAERKAALARSRRAEDARKRDNPHPGPFRMTLADQSAFVVVGGSEWGSEDAGSVFAAFTDAASARLAVAHLQAIDRHRSPHPTDKYEIVPVPLNGLDA